MSLSDRQFLGDELTAPELDFIHAHEHDCATCAREAALLRELRPPPLHVVPSEDEVRRILLQAELTPLDSAGWDETAVVRSSSSRRRVAAGVGAGAALLALVASLALWFGNGAGTRDSSARASLSATSVPAHGKSSLPRSASWAPPEEGSCGPLVRGIVLCLAPGSEVGQVELAGPRRTVELKRGRAVASLEPQPKGSSFSIVTRDGEVTAVGTIFSVELVAGGGSLARVTRGKVLVRGKNGAAQPLLAGQRLRLGDAAASALPLSEAERDLELAARWPSPSELAESNTEPFAPEAEGPGAPESHPAEPGLQRGLEDELRLARDLMARGLFSRAAAIYRSVHARSPGSERGRAALMSLASLQLSALGEPKGALASYEAYLAGGKGPLRQQAEYGRIRALRRLGRSADELEATRRFIKRYPTAPEARLLKERTTGAGGF